MRKLRDRKGEKGRKVLGYHDVSKELGNGSMGESKGIELEE